VAPSTCVQAKDSSKSPVELTIANPSLKLDGSSAACWHLTSKTVEEARNLTAFELDRILGGLPPSKRHALWMVLECLHKALGPRQVSSEEESK
ncbi:MAG: hypothetical protein AB1758_38495, partial [Candidatus Eremiobacterota bacterium]